MYSKISLFRNGERQVKCKLKLEDGRELTVEIDENTLRSIEEPKKTGYEKVAFDEKYWIFDGYDVYINYCNGDTGNKLYYENANYYSDKTVAENNARADTLMRKLRRFAVEHRKRKLDWGNDKQKKWLITYWHDALKIAVDHNLQYHGFGQIYFDSKETTLLAIEEFKDELIWYFTEYKDSL